MIRRIDADDAAQTGSVDDDAVVLNERRVRVRGTRGPDTSALSGSVERHGRGFCLAAYENDLFWTGRELARPI